MPPRNAHLWLKPAYHKTNLRLHTFCNEAIQSETSRKKRQAMFYRVICVSCWPVLGKETIYKRISPHWLTISKPPSAPSWMSPPFSLLLERFVHAVPAGICKTQVSCKQTPGYQPEGRTPLLRTNHLNYWHVNSMRSLHTIHLHRSPVCPFACLLS